MKKIIAMIAPFVTAKVSDFLAKRATRAGMEPDKLLELIKAEKQIKKEKRWFFPKTRDFLWTAKMPIVIILALLKLFSPTHVEVHQANKGKRLAYVTATGGQQYIVAYDPNSAPIVEEATYLDLQSATLIGPTANKYWLFKTSNGNLILPADWEIDGKPTDGLTPNGGFLIRHIGLGAWDKDLSFLKVDWE